MIKLPIDLKKGKPQTLIFISLVSLVILVFYFNLLLRPQVARLKDLFSKTGKAKADLRAAAADISKKDELKRDIATYKENVDRYEKRLPAEQEIPSLLEGLSDMAKSSNIKILGITPVPPTFKEPRREKSQIYQEMPILIAAKSGYHELGQFLSKLENADRFMKVVDIDVKSNKSSPRKHDVELLICTYILLKEK